MENLKNVENKIRSLNHEEVFIVDSKTGKVIWNNSGETSSVDVYEAKIKGLLTNNILTHNHPTGTSFSPKDIKLLIENNIHEIRAVGTKYTHSMIFTGKYTKDKIKKLVNVYNEAFTKTKKNQPEDEFHLIWKKVTDKLDFLIYNRE
jgi:hypothetical protein